MKDDLINKMFEYCCQFRDMYFYKPTDIKIAYTTLLELKAIQNTSFAFNIDMDGNKSIFGIPIIIHEEKYILLSCGKNSMRFEDEKT